MISKIVQKQILRIKSLGNLNAFSKRKGLEQNIKQKQSKASLESTVSKGTQQTTSDNLLQLSQMRILNTQFFPLSLLITPSLFKMAQMFDPYFLLGQLLVQKYASIALMMNLDFQGNRKKAFLILTLMASLHTLTGYYSLITPLGLAFLSIVSPFKYCNSKEKYTESESVRMKTMTNIRMIYFFIFVMLTIFKGFHYEAVYGIERKIDQLNAQNLAQTKKVL